MIIEVLHNQTLWDIALQHCGTTAAVWDIAQNNSKNVTDELKTGEKIEITEDIPRDELILRYINKNKITIATQE